MTEPDGGGRTPTGPLGEEVVAAAGAVVWRACAGTGQVLLVHRPARPFRTADWSWPKGKLDLLETAPAAAVREVAEETGLQIVLGPALPSVDYPLPDGRTKVVRYWTARAHGGGDPRLDRPYEVDRAEWVGIDEARLRLTWPHDAELLPSAAAWVIAHPDGTWPLILLRHGQAHPRRAWARADAERPLVPAGERQSIALATLLAAWRPTRLLSSPWQRCLATVTPFATAAGVRLRTKGSLTEDTAERAPHKVERLVGKLFDAAEPALLCTHRPVLPLMLSAVAERSGPVDADLLRSARLAPGELLVAHVSGSGSRARVVATERHLP